MQWKEVELHLKTSFIVCHLCVFGKVYPFLRFSSSLSLSVFIRGKLGYPVISAVIGTDKSLEIAGKNVL